MATVLIADGETHHRRLYKKELEKEGYQVVLSGSGEEALLRLEESPDVVVLEVCLPGISGPDLLGQLLVRRPILPIIINTSYPADSNGSLRRYADAYIVKSSDLAELKSAVKNWVRNRTSDP